MKLINLLKISKSRFFLLIILTLFLIWSFFVLENKIFSIHFVDEEDNLVLGKYLLADKKLYSDLFSHHQPLAYIFSAGVQQVTRPNSIYLLIKRNREAIFFWGVLWGLVLVLSFGLPLLLFVILFELSKYFLFGNMFLAESLVIYPLVYVVSKIFLTDRKFGILDIIICGFCLGLSALLLSTVWPLLFLLAFLILDRTYLNFFKTCLFLLLGALPWICISLLFSSLNDYFFNTFYINFKYYIPRTGEDQIGIANSLKAFTTPIISLVTNIEGSRLQGVIKIFSGVFIILTLGNLFKKKFKLIFLILLSLGLANIRYVIPGLEYYNGFHLLPWYGLLIFFVIYLLLKFRDKSQNYIALKMLVIFLLISTMIYFGFDNLFKKTSRDDEFYINYSRQFDIGEAVRTIKKDSDTLFIAPDEWLVYWQADITPASKMLNYYAWMADVPELNSYVSEMFKTTPPTFFYYHLRGSNLDQYTNSYTQLKKDGEYIKLYVQPEKLKNLSKSQKEHLNFLNFSW